MCAAAKCDAEFSAGRRQWRQASPVSPMNNIKKTSSK